MKLKFVFPAVLMILLSSATHGYAQVAPGTLFYFPQVAVGTTGGLQYRTIYAFTNPGATPLQVRVDFFDSNGNPLNLEATDFDEKSLGTRASADVPVPPNAISGFIVGPTGTIKTGWAKVTSSGPVWAVSAFEAYSLNGVLLSSVGVPPMTAQQEVVMLVINESHDGNDVGVAIANPSDSPLTITATLTDAAGVQVRQVPINLAARGHRAVFSLELFPNTNETFLGKMILTAPAPFTAMSLLIQGALMTSMPVFRR